MFYYLYLITNWYNGKIYIGIHKTNNLNDEYFGSGTYLKRAINKYGIEYFTKEILWFYETEQEMIDAEIKIVNEEFIKRKDTYNITLGGYGSWNHCNGENHNNLNNHKRIGNIGWKVRPIINDEYKQKISAGLKIAYKNGLIPPFLGKKHTDEAKKRISEANKINQAGENNSMAKRVWVKNLELKESKPILKDELESYLIDGWVKGQVLDFNKLEKKEQEKIDNKIKKQKIKQDINLEKINEYKEIYEIYLQNSSYRITAEKFNTSHVTIFNKVKKYLKFLVT